jgi:hypothetical protein
MWWSKFLRVTLPLWLPFFIALWSENGQALKNFVFLTAGNYFSCEIPADWSKEEYLSEHSPQGDKIYGVVLSSARTEPVPTRISIFFYAEGNPLYPSREVFISRKSKPQLIFAQGDNYGKVTDIFVSGKKAKSFELRKSEFVAPEPLLFEPANGDVRVYERLEKMARQILVRERFVVVPADAGFYALHYTVRASCYKKFLGTFERVTDTFRALR